MAGQKNILIIIDDSKETAKIAADISSALKGNAVTLKAVSDFKGNDILPADAFFLGCEGPNPGSFAYIEDLFLHINLAGRPCGVFSPASKEAVKYLTGLIHDSEAAVNPNPFLGSNKADINSWSQNVVEKSF